MTHGASAQQWSLYGGASLSYDGIFRDKAVTKYKSKWPFLVAGGLVAGAGYKVDNGFDVFAEVNAGALNLKLPAPDASDAHAYLTGYYVCMMAGSGPRFETGRTGNSLTPFLQLGGAYLINNGYATSGNDRVIEYRQRNGPAANNWAIAVGAGIDWRFYAIVSSSINVNFSYTPLNIFKDPYGYNVTSATGAYDIDMQGKLLQILLSYRVHLNLGKRLED